VFAQAAKRMQYNNLYFVKSGTKDETQNNFSDFLGISTHDAPALVIA